MSSAADPQPDPVADEIVAYLDGELPPQDCRRVESRLAEDEKYRQELNELDRAWSALDALPASTVDDGFARTTIELACVAAAADLTNETTTAQAADRRRAWRWIAAGVAACVFGFVAGRALLPHHNGALLADLPAIQQQDVLPYVKDVAFLRALAAKVPTERLVKDETVLNHGMEELQKVNSPSIDTRREWVQEQSPERRAVLADRARAFNDIEPASEEREHMRQIMEEIRNDKDSANLQKTLVAYGRWLSRHTPAEQELLLEQLADKPANKQAEVVERYLNQDQRDASRHLSSGDAEKLRQEIVLIGQQRRDEFAERVRNGRKEMQDERSGGRQRSMFFLGDLFREDKRDQLATRLVGKLSSPEQDYWKSLEGPRKWAQLGIWIQDAMKLKADPKQLELFFASDKLTPELRQKLLDKPYANMEADLERMYISSELGVENPGQFFREFGDAGRRPWGGPGMGPPREGPGGNRPPGGFGPGPRPDGPPDDRRPRRPPPPGEGPPRDSEREPI